MTVIAFHAGVMAADSCSFQGEMRTPTPFPKITRSPAGELFGFAGDLADGWKLRKWALAGADMGDMPAWVSDAADDPPHIIMAKPDGTAWISFDGANFTPSSHPAVIGEPTARAFCLGVMETGVGAAEAVRLAIRRCVWIGGKVQVEAL